MERLRTFGWWLACAACVLFARLANGQCTTGFLPGFRSPGITSTVASTNAYLTFGSVQVLLPFDPDFDGPLPEHLLAGGRFGNIEGTPALNLAVFDGSAWTEPMPLPARLTSATVEAAAFYRDQWYIAGTLTNTGGLVDVFRWNGTAWESLGADFVGGTVKVLLPFDGQLFVGGSFTSMQGQAGTQGIVRLLPDGTLASVASGVDGGSVEAMRVFAGELYVGGNFLGASGVASVGAARWTQGATPTWQATAGLPVSADLNVLTFAEMGGVLYAGGVLRDAPQGSHVGLARLDISGEPSWTAISTGQGLTNVKLRSLTTLATSAGDRLVALASEPFVGLNGQWQAMSFDGTTWSAMTDTPPASELALGLVVTAGKWRTACVYQGVLVAANPGLTSPNVACSNVLATWDGVRFGTFANGLDGSVADFAVFENDIIIAGSFRFAGGRRVNGVARFDGTRFVPMGQGVLSSSTSTAQIAFDLHVHDNTLYVSGQLNANTPAGTLGAVGRWNGTNWVRTVAGSITNPSPQGVQLATQSNQLLLASNAPGVGVQRFVVDRWLSTNNTSSGVVDMESWQGALHAAGSIDGVRRWDGATTWTQIASTAGLTQVADMLPRASDLLVLADTTFPIGGALRSSVIRVANDTAATVTPLGSLAVTNVGSLSGQLAEFQGDVWAAKQFNFAGGSTPAARVVRWNGLTWQAISGDVGGFAPGASDSSLIRAGSVFVQDVPGGQGIVWIGGFFGSCGPVINGFPRTPSPFVARYVASSQPVIAQQPVSIERCAGTAATFTVDVGSSQDVVFRWLRNGVALADGALANVGTVSGSATASLRIESLLASAGGTLTCIASSACGTTISQPATLTMLLAPAIGQQPASARFCPGDEVSFSVTATPASATFSWRRGETVLEDGVAANGAIVAGATTSRLTIANIQGDDVGEYICVVSTACGERASGVALVTLKNSCCDSIDFNNDGLFPSDEDVVEFLTVLAGGSCSEGNVCNDVDFNNDTLFPDDADVLAFFRVLAGGACAE